MIDNEFEIKPRYARRRPMPPGQTRHMYADAVEKTDLTNDDNEVDTQPEEETITDPQPKVRVQGRRSERKRNAPLRTASTEPPRFIRFLMDRRLHLWIGLLCILVSIGIVIILLSYMKKGALNQAVVLNMNPQQIIDSEMSVEGAVGPFGAWMGHILFARSFGIGAFVIAFYFAAIGFRLVGAKKFNFWGLTLRCLLLAITVSIVVGFITYEFGSEISWGGTHGHYMNKWLLDMTGLPGALLFNLALIATLIALYFNELRRFVLKYKEKRALRREQREALLNERRKAHLEEIENQHDEPEFNEITTDEEDEPADEVTESEESTQQPASEPDVVFEIDTPVDAQPESPAAENKKDTGEPGFEIDVPIAETGKNTGTVAERLVAEKGEIDPRAELSRFKFPTLDMLEDRPIKATVDTEEQQANKDRIIKTLGNYNITIESIKATVGPTVTLYEIVPSEGIRIAQIKRLEDDIAMSLSAKGIRIIAPMPGKGTVGIEVPNREPQVVSMRTIMASKKFRESTAKLPVALGATISNEIFVADLTAMPHALVAGATGQGKSVGLNVLISSLLFRKHPAELKFVLIDPKMVEFSVYERLRGHYLASLPGEEDAIVTDPSKVLNVLNSLCVEMDNRYALLRNAAVNKIEDYNRKWCQRRLSADKGHKYLPYIVVIIDEFADLIMTGGKEIEMPVMRITQKARAVGIHMIIATQRPSTNVLTGLIKSNCPTRIAFRVQQMVDSRTILDCPGAQHLIGRGDMLYSQGGELERMQCAFISSDEVERICDSIDNQPGLEPYILPEPLADNGAFGMGGAGSLPAGGLDRDPLFDEAARFVVTSSTASTSSLQRRFEIGYNRAGKIMDQMEASGIVGPASGSKPRAVLVDPTQLERILMNR